jgi:hypothetical protein
MIKVKHGTRLASFTSKDLQKVIDILALFGKRTKDHIIGHTRCRCCMRKNKTDDGCMLPLQSSGATVWYGNDGPTDHDPSGTSVTSLLVSVRLSPAAAALEKKMLYCCVTGLSWVIGSYLGHVRIHG